MQLCLKQPPAHSLVHYDLVSLHLHQDKPGSIHHLMSPTVIR